MSSGAAWWPLGVGQHVRQAAAAEGRWERADAIRLKRAGGKGRHRAPELGCGRDRQERTEQVQGRPNPTHLPAAEQAADWFAKRIGGIAQSGLTESVLNVPTTAHILGGAVIGPDAGRGVVDAANRVYGYENMLICDGSAVPANPGVNPSLTITALAEHAMARVPANGVPLELPEAARSADESPSLAGAP